MNPPEFILPADFYYHLKNITMYRKIFPLILFVLLFDLSAFSQNYPFPQHIDYNIHIKPGQYTQEQLDDQVRSFYDGWKNKHLINGCEDNHYYIYVDDGNTVTVSEAMGYGMMIIPIMAGYDPDAKVYFDGLYRYYKAHPSFIMPHLMAWKQITGCVNSGGPDSASDGDIDIAFGLLLAHAQWGSQGEINYLQQARAIISDIMGDDPSEGDINQNYNTIKLGDWVSSGSYMNGTRSSDFIMDHFRTFECASHDTTWSYVVERCYDLISDMQTDYSSETGLLPDFIDDIDTEPRPADPNYLEGELDGNYSYNACRDPWRLANDYLIFGDERAREAVVKINEWLLESSGGSANHVYAGYYLDGTKADGWSDIAFTAPFAVGAMLDTNNQEWLNTLYAKVLTSNVNSGGYYDNTLKLLSMLTISGNYWVPPCELINGTDDICKKDENHFLVYPTATKGNLTLKINSEFRNEKLNIRVFNGFGNQIIKRTVQNLPQAIIDLSGYSNGIYLIGIYTDKGESLGIQRVIKQ